MNPEMSREGFDFIANWKELGVRAVFRGVEDKPGAVTAEVEVISEAEGGRLFFWGHVNFIAPNTMTRFVNKLTKEWASGERDELPWEEMLQQASYWVAKQVRKGEPFLQIGRRPRQERRRYRVDGIIPEGVTSSIFGDGGNGKGFLAIDMGICVQTGMDYHGFEVLKGNVLYLDWETDEMEIEGRIQRVCQGYNLAESAEITYRHCFFPLRAELPAILKEVHSKAIQFVIVDSVGLATGGDINGPNDVIEAFGQMRLLGCTVLAIDHVNKSSSGEEAQKAIGSVYKHDLARCTWEIRRDETSPDDTLTVGMFHRKANQGQRRKNPIVFNMRFDGEEGPVTITDGKLEGTGLIASANTGDRILVELKNGKLTKKQLAERLGNVSEGTVGTWLSRLRGRGIVACTASKVPEWFRMAVEV